ncbi:MAG: thioredoxin family protein [Epsilonproteobacteria bacterium]|nr:thioredoxin family protein [Campylobacterota bacterium]
MRRNNIFLIFISFFGLFSGLYGGSIEFATSMKYQTNYDEAIKKAKEEKKPIMLVLSSTSCPWCRKMENQTLNNETINQQVQENFIPLALDKDNDTYPKKFFPQYVPTVLFINPHTEDYFDQLIGYKSVSRFQKNLDEAITDSKKYQY